MSVVADFQVSSLFPSTVGGLGTSPMFFPRVLGTSIGNQSTAPSITSAKGQLAVPGDSSLDGQWFTIFAGGSILGGSSSEGANIQLIANLVSPLSGLVPSYDNGGSLNTSYVIANLGYLPINGAGAVPNNWALKAQVFCATASGILGGVYSSYFDNVIQKNGTVLDNALTGVSMASALPFGLVIAVTFLSSEASNSAKLTQFQIGRD